MPTPPHDLIGAGWAFPPAVGAGGVALASHDDEIIQAIRIILETPTGSRVMRPEFGSRLHELVFAPINAATMAATQRAVEQALGYWEPRISVQSVEVLPHPDHAEVVLIVIDYQIRSTYDERSLVVPFYTIPGETL
jgi:hypothetical protein